MTAQTGEHVVDQPYARLEPEHPPQVKDGLSHRGVPIVRHLDQVDVRAGLETVTKGAQAADPRAGVRDVAHLVVVHADRVVRLSRIEIVSPVLPGTVRIDEPPSVDEYVFSLDLQLQVSGVKVRVCPALSTLQPLRSSTTNRQPVPPLGKTSGSAQIVTTYLGAAGEFASQ